MSTFRMKINVAVRRYLFFRFMIILIEFYSFKLKLFENCNYVLFCLKLRKSYYLKKNDEFYNYQNSKNILIMHLLV